MSEIDPKELGEGVLLPETAVEEPIEDGGEDLADEGEAGDAADAGEPGAQPGEPSRRKRRRRRRRGRTAKEPRDGGAAGEPSPEEARPREASGRKEPAREGQPSVVVKGVVKLHGDHSGILVPPDTLYPERGEPFLPKYLVEAEDLEDGLLIEAEAAPRSSKGPMVQKILRVEGLEPADYRARYLPFHKGISIDPTHRFRLETTPDDISGRVIDLVTPIGRGQRCLIVSPPKAGKTTLLKVMANGIARNDPEAIIFMLLVDERPEEVTDMQRSLVRAEVIASSADMNAARHIAVAETTFERAKRLVEIGHHVVIFCDSLTRMSRAYNNEQRGSGKILSGGIDARTMEKPRRFFGGARNHEDGGSLTIIATALVDTGSRMDDVIFEEFKGTGNCEIILDRSLFERRVFPCVNIPASGTRKEEKLYTPEELPKIHKLRRALASVKAVDAMELLLGKLMRTRTNEEFLRSIL